MKYWMILKQSLKAIFANKGRSFLTVLGIIIGIGSVIALISLGKGVQSQIDSQINKLGSKNLTISPGGNFAANGSGSRNSASDRGGAIGGGGFSLPTSTLTVTDLKSLQDPTKTPDVQYSSGTVSGSVTITTNSTDLRYSFSGVDVEQFSMSSLAVREGNLFTEADVQNANKVAVIGDQVALDNYSGVSAIGRLLTVGTDQYRIIGVLAKKDESGFSNPNIVVYAPYSAVMKTVGNENFGSMTVQAKSDSVVDAAKTEVEKALLADHKITDPKKADFTVLTSKDLLSTIGNITGVITSLLAGIAAISLVVGGIGIMNIMLVSVTERTREIGLRKAVGAKTSDVLLQFMVEAILLTLVGGILGIGLGYLIGFVAARFLNFAPIVTLQAISLAVGVSSAVGLVFGIYPAAKAARLNPIDALRYE